MSEWKSGIDLWSTEIYEQSHGIVHRGLAESQDTVSFQITTFLLC